jgi:hypothetical protein
MFRRKKMPISKTKRSLKGLQNIKTISGQRDVLASPYKDYMKLSILEMEKFRKNKERISALETLEAINQRFVEIDEEKRKLLARLEEQNVQQFYQNNSDGKTQSSCESKNSFKIKY